MKLVRAVAILVGLADLAFGVYFLVGAGSMDTVNDVPEYARWAGVCSLASAALLFLLASDPERYFNVIFISAGGRALVALIALPALTRQIHMVISEGALAAVLVLVVIHSIKERRAAAGDAAVVVKPAKKPDKPGAGGKASS